MNRDNAVTEKAPGDALGRDPHVESVIQHAHGELRELVQQRDALKRRIGTVKKTIVGLVKIFGESALSSDVRDIVIQGSSNRRPNVPK